MQGHLHVEWQTASGQEGPGHVSQGWVQSWHVTLSHDYLVNVGETLGVTLTLHHRLTAVVTGDDHA